MFTIADSRLPTRSSTSDLGAWLIDAEEQMHRATISVLTKSISVERALPKPDALTPKKVAPSSMVRILAVHSINRAIEKMSSTVLDRDSNTNVNKRSASKSVVKSSPNICSKMKFVLRNIIRTAKSSFWPGWNRSISTVTMTLKPFS